MGDLIDTNLTVNHIDGNRLNNRIDNLEWLSRSDNITYGFENNQYRTICKKCTLINNNNKYEFNSLSKASEFLGRSKAYISNTLKKGTNIKDKDNNIYTVLIQ